MTPNDNVSTLAVIDGTQTALLPSGKYAVQMHLKRDGIRQGSGRGRAVWGEMDGAHPKVEPSASGPPTAVGLSLNRCSHRSLERQDRGYKSSEHYSKQYQHSVIQIVIENNAVVLGGIYGRAAGKNMSTINILKEVLRNIPIKHLH